MPNRECGLLNRRAGFSASQLYSTATFGVHIMNRGFKRLVFLSALATVAFMGLARAQTAGDSTGSPTGTGGETTDGARERGTAGETTNSPGTGGSSGMGGTTNPSGTMGDGGTGAGTSPSGTGGSAGMGGSTNPSDTMGDDATGTNPSGTTGGTIDDRSMDDDSVTGDRPPRADRY